MNDNGNEKSWVYWIFLCIKQLAVVAPYLYTGFLVWCGCKYDVSIGVWIAIFLLGFLGWL